MKKLLPILALSCYQNEPEPTVEYVVEQKTAGNPIYFEARLKSEVEAQRIKNRHLMEQVARKEPCNVCHDKDTSCLACHEKVE